MMTTDIIWSINNIYVYVRVCVCARVCVCESMSV